MADITTDNNYITVLCSKCGGEVKVDITTGLSNGVKNWYSYHCLHCGHIGSIEDNMISPEHRAYSLDEILEINKKEKPIQEENSLNRIANALEDIRDILKRLDIHRR